jgi:serine/threonine-protein kinase RsbW
MPHTPDTTGAPEGDRSVAPPAQPRLTPAITWRRVFPGEPQQLALLRYWLASLLPPRPERDDVITVADELASNAIQHTRSGRGGQFTVSVT